MAQQMSNILRALANSVGVSLASIVILLFIDVLAAYIIARRKGPALRGLDGAALRRHHDPAAERS